MLYKRKEGKKKLAKGKKIINAPILKSKDEVIDIFSIMRSRRYEQILKGEDVNKFLHIPFNQKYKNKIKTIPSNLFSIFQIGFQATNNDKYIVPDYQRGLVWKLENKQHFIAAIMSGSPIGDFIFSRKEVYTVDDFYYEWEVIS